MAPDLPLAIRQPERGKGATMKITPRKVLNRSLMLAVLAPMLDAGCAYDSVEDEADETPAEGVKGHPAGLTSQDLEEAIHLDLQPGLAWEASASGAMSPTSVVPGARPLTLTTVSAQSWAPLSAGESKTVTFTLGSAQSMAAFAQPHDELGNLDLDLYKWDAGAASWHFVKQSVRGAGFIDSIFTPPYMSGWEGEYSLKLYCRTGTCSFSSNVTKGDDEDFHTFSVYLNQRSFTANTNRCTNAAGAWVADGECMCADASAAMGLVAGGKRKISELRSAAQDLFENTNNPDGAANRWALMERLKASYGYDDCADLPLDEENIRFRLRYKWLVLLRSPRFSSAGHYVQVRGYKTEDGVFKVRVNDPYGVWSSKNVWDPLNTTSTGYGQDAVIRLSLLKAPGASLVVCK